MITEVCDVCGNVMYSKVWNTGNPTLAYNNQMRILRSQSIHIDFDRVYEIVVVDEDDDDGVVMQKNV